MSQIRLINRVIFDIAHDLKKYATLKILMSFCRTGVAIYTNKFQAIKSLEFLKKQGVHSSVVRIITGTA